MRYLDASTAEDTLRGREMVQTPMCYLNAATCTIADAV